MKVTILGTGAYGLSLAIMFNENKCDITMWSKFDDEVALLKKNRGNEKLLPGIKMPREIKFTSNIEDAVSDSDLIVIAIPAAFCDGVFKLLKPYFKNNQHICIATKGIEQDTCLFINEVLKKYIKTKNVSVISGPSFAIDIASKVPIGLALATKSDKTKAIVKDALENEYLKLRTTRDMLGIEICGSIKNVIAIAAGMLDGMGLPESTQAMFITESLHDIKILIRKLGGKGKAILTFAGFGDLLLTCTSVKSRNFRFGKMIGEKRSKEEIDAFVNETTIEGLYTLKSIFKLIDTKLFDIPIISLIYDIVFNDVPCERLKTFLIEKD